MSFLQSKVQRLHNQLTDNSFNQNCEHSNFCGYIHDKYEYLEKLYKDSPKKWQDLVNEINEKQLCQKKLLYHTVIAETQASEEFNEQNETVEDTWFSATSIDGNHFTTNCTNASIFSDKLLLQDENNVLGGSSETKEYLLVQIPDISEHYDITESPKIENDSNLISAVTDREPSTTENNPELKLSSNLNALHLNISHQGLLIKVKPENFHNQILQINIGEIKSAEKLVTNSTKFQVENKTDCGPKSENINRGNNSKNTPIKSKIPRLQRNYLSVTPNKKNEQEVAKLVNSPNSVKKRAHVHCI